MKELFDKYGIILTQKQQENFQKYCDILLEYNQKFNITAITDKTEIYIKHFIDSLLFHSMFNCGNLLDVGSGGGFPAIPLKIINPNLNITMLEATGKKCEFLQAVIKELKLDNIKVINGRAEEYAIKDNFREKFDYCSARAVASLNILSEYCLPFVKIGGFFIAYKGDVKEELENSQKAIEILGGKVENVEEKLLEDARRSVVVVKKVKSCNKIYPRSNAKIRKNPL